MQRNFFLSFHNADFVHTRQVVDVANRKGYHCIHYDPDTLWEDPIERISQSIEEQGDFVLCLRLGRKSLSRVVAAEVEWAQSCEIPVLYIDSLESVESKLDEAIANRKTDNSFFSAAEQFDAFQRAFSFWGTEYDTSEAPGSAYTRVAIENEDNKYHQLFFAFALLCWTVPLAVLSWIATIFLSLWFLLLAIPTSFLALASLYLAYYTMGSLKAIYENWRRK